MNDTTPTPGTPDDPTADETPVGPTSTPPDPAPSTPPPGGSSGGVIPRGRRLILAVVAAALVGALAGAGAVAAFDSDGDAPGGRERPSLDRYGPDDARRGPGMGPNTMPRERRLERMREHRLELRERWADGRRGPGARAGLPGGPGGRFPGRPACDRDSDGRTPGPMEVRPGPDDDRQLPPPPA